MPTHQDGESRPSCNEPEWKPPTPWRLLLHNQLCLFRLTNIRRRKKKYHYQSPLRPMVCLSPWKAIVKRKDTVEGIYHKALQHQHVVVSSPAASGKTSLLQILKFKLRGLEEKYSGGGENPHDLRLDRRRSPWRFERTRNSSAPCRSEESTKYLHPYWWRTKCL